MRGFPLPDGSVFVMVVGHLKTPCGRVIQRQYRSVTRHDYYRLAGAERDTVGRPSCRTDGGRTVYGGGGIYPDIMLGERSPAPVWLARVHEEALPLKWTPGFLDAHGASLGSLDALAGAPRLPDGALASFRAFAAEQRVTIPDGADADRLLERALLLWVADTKWGEPGLYRLRAVLDSDVKAAVAAFAKAQEILAP